MPKPDDHGIGSQLARVLLTTTACTNVDWRTRLLGSLPPDYCMRRWVTAQKKSSYRPKSYDSFQNWLFANIALTLEEIGHIEREYPDNDRGSPTARYNVWLTAKGVQQRAKDLVRAAKAPPEDLIRLLLPSKPTLDPTSVLDRLAELEDQAADDKERLALIEERLLVIEKQLGITP